MGNNYLLGYKGILNPYTVKRNLRSWTSRLIALLSIGVSVFLFCCKETAQIVDLLNKVVDVLLGILPDLLGFCIGGYAILVAMNNLEKMPAMLKKQEKSDLSYYVNLSADFAMALLIMSILLLCAFLMRFIIDMEIPAINDNVSKIVNLLVLSLLLWAGVLAIIMIMGTVANIFSTSFILQAIAKINNEAEEEKLKENRSKDSDNFTEEIDYVIKTWFGTYMVKKIIKKRNDRSN